MTNVNIDYKDNYINWLKGEIDQHQIDESTYRFTLPFLDRHNDQIEVYIVKNGEDFTITDDGYTVNDLAISGFNIDSSIRRKAIFSQILQSHGVSLSEGAALSVKGKVSELPMKKHMLAQCIQKVDDLFYLTQPNVRSLFLEDVQAYLDANQIRYIPNVSYIGKSKLPTNYDFSIPKSTEAPLRIIKVVNSLTVDYARSILFSWNDISEARRGEESQLLTFIQDQGKKPSSDAITALNEYGVVPIRWSERKKFQKTLTA